MKEMILGAAAFIVILIIDMTGLPSATFHLDDISDQEYRTSLNEAAAIIRREIKKHSISSIHFTVEKELDNPTNTTYEYQLFYEGQVIAVDLTTGRTTVRNHIKRTVEPLSDIEKAEEFKQPQATMKEAVSYYGEKAEMKEWAIVAKDERPYYQVQLIDGKQTQQIWIPV